MGGQGAELQGPDLAAGVLLSDLADGAKLLGHANGEAVLLVRSGKGVFAIGATCTHYGGPLAEGLVVGDTVRCPWHHACFGVRTGEALRPPAMKPVARYRVETRGEKLHVGEAIPPSAPDAAGASVSSVVLIGGGAASNAAAETLRSHGYRGPITMVSADASVPVDRPNLSKDYLAGTAPEEWIPLRPKEFYDELNIRLLLDTRATKIDTAARTVTLSTGEQLGYGALLLATGADPIRLEIPGADLPHVHTLRSLADSRAIIAAAASAKSAVIIGASFIGLEAAASLRTRGVAVHVVAPEAKPLARVMGDAVGDLVRAVHEAHGVVFHLQDTAARIEAGRVVLKSGATIDADLVVVGIGVRPNVALAEAAGIAVDKGVVVDGHLATSAPSVYAAGDIARYPDARSSERLRVEHWVVAQRQGRAAARNILGAAESFDAVPFFWSQHYDLAIAYVGHAESWDEVAVTGDVAKRDASVALKKAGRTLAVVTIGRDETSLRAEWSMERGAEPAID